MGKGGDKVETYTPPPTTEDPAVADKSDPGKDTTYAGGEEPAPAEPLPEVAGHEFEPPEEKPEEEKKSWLKIQLLDEAGEPVPGEKYRITCPDGTIKEGRLDANGMAEVKLAAPEECEVTFPDLDAEAWHPQD